MTFPRVLLSEVAKEVTVGHVGPMASEYVDRGVPFLRSLNIEPFRINLDDVKFITDEFHARLRKSALQPGDVVIVRTGKPGTCAVVPEWLEISNCSDLVVVRCGPDVLPKYLVYWMNSLAAHHVGSNTVGAVQQHFNVGAAKQMPLLLPSLREQELILSALASLDDKIESNRRMNEKLEAMAQAIFRDWFIDFGPVRRKLAGATDPVEIMGRLVADPARAAELAGSQPVAFADDGRPSGWSVRYLSELTTELRRGIGPKYVERDGVLVLNQKCIRNREVSFGPARRHDDGAKSVIGRTLVNGDVLVNSTGVGTLGRVAQIWGLNQRVIVDSHITVVRASSTDFSSIYLGLALGLREEEIVALGEGSTGQTELSREQLGRVEMVVPTKAILDRFDAICAPLVERIQANRQQMATLAETRDYLLPRLMSGEVRVDSLSKEIAA